MIPMLGFEVDEVMFVAHLWHPRSCAAWFSWFQGHELPYMYMSYLGALKSYVFAPVLYAAGPNVWSIRVPALMIGLLTILLAGLLLKLIHGWIAAMVVIALVASWLSQR
jgi:branched-subunit amino acid transport protein